MKNKIIISTILVVIFLSISIYLLNTLRNLSFALAEVKNVYDDSVFIEPVSRQYPLPTKKFTSDGFEKFRNELASLIGEHLDEIELLKAIRHWSRMQQGDFQAEKWCPSASEGDDPLVLLYEQRQGIPGACRRFAYILAGALVSAGFDARLAHIASDFSDRNFNHTFVEVWSKSLNKWILIDSDYDTFYMIDGEYASLLDMYRTVKKGDLMRISFDRGGATYRPKPFLFDKFGEKSDLISSFKHIYVSNTNAVFDGYRVKPFGKKRIIFFHYTEDCTPPYPTAKKMVLVALLAISFILSLSMAIFLFRSLCNVFKLKI